jgi:hypothetical protein
VPPLIRFVHLLKENHVLPENILSFPYFQNCKLQLCSTAPNGSDFIPSVLDLQEQSTFSAPHGLIDRLRLVMNSFSILARFLRAFVSFFP